MDRVARTIEIYRELMALWEVEYPWGVSLSIIYPPAGHYNEIPADEMMVGTDQNIPIKRIGIPTDNDSEYAPITIYRKAAQ